MIEIAKSDYIKAEAVEDFLRKLDEFDRAYRRIGWLRGYKSSRQERLKAAFAMHSARYILEEAMKLRFTVVTVDTEYETEPAE